MSEDLKDENVEKLPLFSQNPGGEGQGHDLG